LYSELQYTYMSEEGVLIAEEVVPVEGRPPVWTDPAVVQEQIDEYFKNETQPTLAGLAVSLGVSRATLYNYEAKTEYLDIIKKARDKVMKVYEERLIYSNMPTGVIFALKNMGWRDRVETDLTSGGQPFPLLGGRSSNLPELTDGLPSHNSDREVTTVK